MAKVDVESFPRSETVSAFRIGQSCRRRYVEAPPQDLEALLEPGLKCLTSLSRPALIIHRLPKYLEGNFHEVLVPTFGRVFSDTHPEDRRAA